MSIHKRKPLPTQKELAVMFRYDHETGKLFRNPLCASDFPKTRDPRGAGWVSNNYNSQFAGKEAFTFSCRQGYKCGKIHGVNFQAHRVIWKLVTGNDPIVIDHINGDTSDNRISNLRACTVADNSRNCKKTSGSTSQFRGVYWVKRDKAWASRISDGNGGKRSLGNYSDEDAAAHAYDAAARELHGEFAILNFPEALAAAPKEASHDD